MKFSQADKDILGNININLLNKSIHFLNSYKKVFWTKARNGLQHLPKYRKNIKHLLMIIRPKHKYDYLLALHKDLSIFLSPLDIYCIIKDSFARERVCDGLIAGSINSRLYLRLRNLLSFYKKEKV